VPPPPPPPNDPTPPDTPRCFTDDCLALRAGDGERGGEGRGNEGRGNKGRDGRVERTGLFEAVAQVQQATGKCTSGPSTASQPLWGKAVKVGRKALEAAKRGEDLLEARTWKRILESEWAEAAQAGMDTQAALNGDPVAFVSVMNYIAEQIVGVGFFDMLQGLKLADRLGLSWYDDVINWITRSTHFENLASSMIGTGHAWDKHGGKYAGVLSTQEEFVNLVRGIFESPDAMRHLERNRRAYWDDTTGTVVIFDPSHPDLGTAFPPDQGYIYFRDVLK
jgi:hypothetical protein